jgi:hypothetical protein
MNTPDSVVGCSSCGALYTPGPGDRGVCLDCRRRAAAAQPRPPSGNTPRPNSLQPVRIGAIRPAGAGVKRPNLALRRTLLRLGVAAAIAAAVGTLVVTQRQRLTNAWTTIQRHGVSKEWATIQRKVFDAWVAIRSETPWPVVEERRSSSATASSSRGTHHHQQVAATATKRKGKKRRDDTNSPGSTP